MRRRQSPVGRLTLLAVLVAVVGAIGALAPGLLGGSPSPSSPSAAPSAVVPASTSAAPAHASSVPTLLPTPRGSQLVPAPESAERSPLVQPSSRFAAAPAGSAAGDLANPALANYSFGATLAAVGPTNASLVLGYTNDSYAADYLNTGSDGAFEHYGLSEYDHTDTAGVQWNSGWIPNDAAWSSTTSPSFGDVLWGGDSVAGANGTALYASVYGQPCAVLELPSTAYCNSTEAYGAPSGVAISQSTDGGAAWGAPVPVDSLAEYTLDSADCTSGFYEEYLPANITDTVKVAISPSGQVAAVVWDVIDYYDFLGCVSGSAVAELIAEYDLTEVSVSTDGGAAWSAPVVLGQYVSGPAAVAVGPGATPTITVVWTDPENGTSTTFPYDSAVSTDLGASWSRGADVGPATMVHPVDTAAPDAFGVATLPQLAEDDNGSSPYEGNLYLVWDDNRTATDGAPSVAYEVGGGGSWSSARYATPLTPSEIYFDPSVTVAPGGTVWLSYYAVDLASGDYQLDGQYSTDGGTTWTQPFAITDLAESPPPDGGALGYWTGSAATTAGFFAGWTDCRSSECAAAAVPSIDVAHVEPVSLLSSVPGAELSASSSGLGVSGTEPVETAWDENAGVFVGASASVPLSNTTEYVGLFTGFTGAVSSASDPALFDYEGGSTVTANYSLARAGFLAGTIVPAVANVTLTVDGVSVALGAVTDGAFPFNISVAPDLIYSIAVTAPGYDSFSAEEPAIAGATTWIPVSLGRSDGWIEGRVVPFSATITVNGTLVPVDATSGLYNLTVLWGDYWVNISSPGLTHLDRLVSVAPGRAASLNVTLIGGWIAGTISPEDATFSIDGTSQPTALGAFNLSELGGSYRLNASAPGYSSWSREVTVAPGATVAVAVSLSDVGWLSGNVDPLTAEVVVAGTPVPVVDGAFNVSLTADQSYNVTVAATGFETEWGTVTIRPVATSSLDIRLPTVGASCTPICPTTPSASSGSSAKFSYADAGLAALAIVGVAAEAAAVILFVRPRSPGPPRRKELYASAGSTAATRSLPPPGSGGAQ